MDDYTYQYTHICIHHIHTQAAKLEGTDAFEDLQEARETELQAFQPASRETEADRSDDRKSLHRKLDRVLYLLVKKPRSDHAWQMPQGGLEEGESLLEVSAVIEMCEAHHNRAQEVHKENLAKHMNSSSSSVVYQY